MAEIFGNRICLTIVFITPYMVKVRIKHVQNCLFFQTDFSSVLCSRQIQTRLPNSNSPPDTSKNTCCFVKLRKVDPADRPSIRGIRGKEQHKQAKNADATAAK